MRTCNLNITPEGVRCGKYNSCLEYQIKNCCAPCIGKISKDDYCKYIDEVTSILKGDIKILQEKLLDEIKENEYNLNIPRYVDTFEEEAIIDIDVVNAEIAEIKGKIADVEEQMEKYLKELGLK